MTKRDREFQILYNEAKMAGLKAGSTVGVIPMVVAEHTSPLNDASPVKKLYFVEGGVCGFAWVNVKPGNCPFANWLKKNDLGRHSDYEGGVIIWDSGNNYFGQSMTRKEAYCHAFAEVLNKAGIRAWANSRID